ncbi:L-rhamnose mutarotase [Subtercola boreus]|uniref:L-rhamnose mutarotase n=1 Tax=Subtercola boreus TaxID=120213 RepID=UPI001B879110
MASLQRVCFQLQVDPAKLDEYRRRHADVWPEFLVELRRTGWQNYSLFLRDDGLLIGYFETPDLALAQAGMAATAVNERWQAEMAEFFEGLEGTPDQGFLQLTEIFNLDDQLGRADAATGSATGTATTSATGTATTSAASETASATGSATASPHPTDIHPTTPPATTAG